MKSTKKTNLSKCWLGSIKIDWILSVLINVSLLSDCELSRPEFPQFPFPLFLEYEVNFIAYIKIQLSLPPLVVPLVSLVGL